MPPPRLPRHLRPCRPLWSARQVRFASDSRSTAGDSSNGAQGKPQTETARSQAQQPRIRKRLSVAPGDSLKKIRATELHLEDKARVQRWQQANTTTQASPSPTEPTTEDVKPLSQAQRMRRALGGPDAATQPPIQRIRTHAPLKISRVHRPGPPPVWRTSKDNSTKQLVLVKSAIAANVAERKKLRQEQVRQEQEQEQQKEKEKEPQQELQAATPTQSEEGLRERLKKLEEQLASLQAKLAADNVAATASGVEAAGATTTDTAEAKAGHSTPFEGAEAVHARPNNSTTAEEKPARRRRKKQTKKGNSGADMGSNNTEEQPSTTPEQPPTAPEQAKAERSDEQTGAPAKTAHTTLAQRIQAQSTSMKSSSHPRPSPSHPPPSQSAPQASPTSDEVSDQSLLDELFPEASSLAPPDLSGERPSPPKLDLPAPDTNANIRLYNMDTRTDREKTIDAFRARGEQTTVLQLSHCSTALTEPDFRRLVPRGKHLDTWSSTGEFYKIIPGRDPLSLARLPFYYLLFHSAAAALAYQKNASRLSKLATLYAPSSTASAVPPPAGFLEDGEDIAAIASSFVLHPQGHALDLRTVMQPYNRSLRALVDAGGYPPIVPNVDERGNKIHRVLLTIDDYEPGHWDLWQIIARHAHTRGILWPWRNDHASALRRLRDAINLKTVSKQKFQALATNPRAASRNANNSSDSSDAEDREFEDPTISAFLGPSSSSQGATGDGTSAREINQLVMNRVYNRWIAEFEDEDAARRFAGLWHRVRLPDAKDRDGKWKEAEEDRWVMAEYLW